jgi:hypothetical protein
MKLSRKSFPFLLAVWLMFVVVGYWISCDTPYVVAASCGDCAYCVQYYQSESVGVGFDVYHGFITNDFTNTPVTQGVNGWACDSSGSAFYTTVSCSEGGCARNTNNPIAYWDYSNADVCTVNSPPKNYAAEASNGVNPGSKIKINQAQCGIGG